MSEITLTVLDPKGRTLATGEFHKNILIESLKKKLQNLTRVPFLQQRLTLQKTENNGKAVVLLNKELLSKYTSSTSETIILKNLGPQLPYIYLFYLEYAIPIFQTLLMYKYSGNKSNTAYWACLVGTLHYVKRVIESKTVHVFSNESVPISGSLKNF